MVKLTAAFTVGVVAGVTGYFRYLYGCWPWSENEFTHYLDTL